MNSNQLPPTRTAINPARFILALVSALICLGFSSGALAQSTKPLSIIKITPSGEELWLPNQITLQFNRPVAPLGRMTRSTEEIAITITPKIECNWSWLNTSALACKLPENARIEHATTYQISVAKRFDNTCSDQLAVEYNSSFSTPRPSILSAWAKGWDAHNLPVLQINTNQKVERESLASHLKLLVNDKSYDLSVTEAPIDPERAATPEELEQVRSKNWLIKPTTPLPTNAKVKLAIKPGLKSLEGNLPGIENRVIQSFATFPEASFVGVSCRDLNDKEIFTPQGRSTQRATRRCDPLNAIRLAFSSPVSKEHLSRSIVSKPDLRGGQTEFDPWEDIRENSYLNTLHQPGQLYYISLPYGLKAATTYTLSAKADAISDIFGRHLTIDLDTNITTDHRLPRFVLDNQVSVLEKEGDSQLPIIVNNIESININYQTLTSSGIEAGLSKLLKPDQVKDIAYPFPIDIRSMLGARSGMVSGTITSSPAAQVRSVKFSSQVTPFAVHLKIGHFSSLAWVTSLKSGEPIADATIKIGLDTPNKPSNDMQPLALAKTDQRGIATLPGTELLDPELEYSNRWENDKAKLVARIERDGEIALVPLSWDYQVYDSEIYGYSNNRYGHVRAWGTTAQGIYKAGDTVQFALWVRNQSDAGLTPPPTAKYSLEVLDPTEKVVHQIKDFTLSPFGQYSGEFKTAPDATVGWYSLRLSADITKETWTPLNVLISDFTPSPFKVSTTINSDLAREGQNITITSDARLHAGGPYSAAPVRVIANIATTPISPDLPALSKFFFESSPDRQVWIHQSEGTLSSNGELSTSFIIPKVEVTHGDLNIESAVSDDRGKSIVGTASVRYLGAERFVGLSQNDWLLEAGKPSSVELMVIDSKYQPTSGAPIDVVIETLETKAARVKSAGNTYTTRYDQVWTALTKCQLVSAITPVSCSFTPAKPGQYRMVATTRDQADREHSSSISRWATGVGETLWSGATNNQLDIVAESGSYELGETARFMIHNPFKVAHALFTIERNGILRSWTETITESTPIIKLPITEDLAPGFYLSATLFSPRVAVANPGEVDLGKPTFRMGYARIDVNEPTKQLDVEIRSDGDNYRPRQKVKIDISSKAHNGSHPEVEYTVVVIDQSVFELLRSGSERYNPYSAFHQIDTLDVLNYNLLKMLIGRQKFEKKGANAGGDGGSKIDMRSIKSYISYWNPALKADADGKASISFEAPDNLTSWLVFAIAFTKGEQMGLGEGSFVVSKDTELRSSLPNQVREGDRFSALFTLTNRADTTRSLEITSSATGVSSTPGAPYKLSAEPFKRYPIEIPAVATSTGTASFTVKAADATGSDALIATVPVLPRIAPIKSAVSNSSTSQTELQVSVPSDIRAEHSSLALSISSTILGDLRGAFGYMRQYPFECWEQRLSKAVVAALSKPLSMHLPSDFDHKEAELTISKVLQSAAESQAPNGGMSFFLAQDEHTDPYLSAYTALAFVWLRELGHQAPAQVTEKLNRYLNNLLLNDRFPTHYSTSQIADFRALTVAALAASKGVTTSEALRLKSAYAGMSLFGKAQLISALNNLNVDPKVISQLLSSLIRSGIEGANTFNFASDAKLISAAALDSSAKAHCALLESLTSVASNSSLNSTLGLDRLIPKLAQFIINERRQGDRWNDTHDNTFCLKALAKYSSKYERIPELLEIGVMTDGQKIGQARLDSKTTQLELKYPIASGDIGRAKTLTLVPNSKLSEGTRFYYTSTLTYTPNTLPDLARTSGLEVSRDYWVNRGTGWQKLNAPITIKRGELVRVDLRVSSASRHDFVVLADSVPGGLEPVNRQLAITSEFDANIATFEATKNQSSGDKNASSAFYHSQLRNSSVTFYSERMPSGAQLVSYTAQAVADGEFIALPAHAEEMYAPEVSGDSVAQTIRVEQ